LCLVGPYRRVVVRQRVSAYDGVVRRRWLLGYALAAEHLLRVDDRRAVGADSGRLALERVADWASRWLALGLPPDYFLEFREAYVIERIRSDPKLRNDLYARLIRDPRA